MAYMKSPEIGGISFNYMVDDWKVDLMQDLYGRNARYWYSRVKLADYWKLVSIVSNILNQYKAPHIIHSGHCIIPYAIRTGPSSDSFLAFILKGYTDADEANDVLNDFYGKYYKDLKPILCENIRYEARYELEPDLNPRIERTKDKFDILVLLKMPGNIDVNDVEPILEKYKDYIGEAEFNDMKLTPKSEVNEISGNWCKSPQVDGTQFWYYLNEDGLYLNDIISKVFNGDVNAHVPYSGCGCIHSGLVSVTRYYRFLRIMYNYIKNLHEGKYKMALMSTREYEQKLDSPSLRRQGTFYMSVVVFTDTIEEAEELLDNYRNNADSGVHYMVEEYRVIPNTTIPECNASSNMVEFLLKGVGVDGVYGSDYLRLRDKYKDLLLPIDSVEPEIKPLGSLPLKDELKKLFALIDNSKGMIILILLIIWVAYFIS